MSCPKVSDGVMQSRSRFGAIWDKTSNPRWLGRHALIVVEIASPSGRWSGFQKAPEDFGLKPVVNGFVKSWGAAFKTRVFFESLPPPNRVGSEDDWKQETAWSDSALTAKKNFVAQKLRWNHVFMQSVWKGMRGDHLFSLHWPDTLSIQ